MNMTVRIHLERLSNDKCFVTESIKREPSLFILQTENTLCDKVGDKMQCKRRYAHLIIIITAYAFLILAGRWAFFTEMWTIMGEEPNTDGEHAHALGLDFAVPVRAQRDVPDLNTNLRDSNSYMLKYEQLNRKEFARSLKRDYIAKRNRRNQLLHTIFTNFLHP